MVTKVTTATSFGEPAKTMCCLSLILLRFCPDYIAADSGSPRVKLGTFTEQPLCYVQQRLDNKCMLEVSQGESLIRCCRQCLSANECVGASLCHSNKKCYLHTHCDAVDGCSTQDNGYTYMKKLTVSTTATAKISIICDHGHLQNDTQTCKCDYGYCGQRCERICYDCLDLKDYIDPPEMFYNNRWSLNVRPRDYTVTFHMHCEVYTSSASIYLFNHDGSKTFNRTWHEYTETIADPSMKGGYWMGLEHMRFMLGPGERDVNIVYLLRPSPDNIIISYRGFRLGDASTNYTLTYSSYEITWTDRPDLTPGDCLSLSNMTQFSTIDVDNDDDPSDHCAKKANAGWWFSSCNFSCNPLGTFWGQSPAPPTEDGYLQLTGLGFMHNKINKVIMSYKEYF